MWFPSAQVAPFAAVFPPRGLVGGAGRVGRPMEVPDQGRLALCAQGGRSWLIHTVTRERAALPGDLSHEWRLAFDKEGFGFVAKGDETLWAADVLQLRLVSMEGVGLVVLDEDVATPLQEFLHQQRRKHLVVPFSGRSGLVVVLFMFARVQIDECKFWWGLSSLYKAFEFDSVPAREWISNLQRWWSKRLLKLGFDRPHLRPSVRARWQEHPAHGVDDRCLDEASVSTPALLALLSQFCKERTNSNKKQAILGAWQEFLVSLLKLCLVGRSEFFLRLEQGVVVGELATADDSEAAVAVVLEGCTLDLKMLRGRGRLAQQTLRHLCDGGTAVSASDALLRSNEKRWA